MSDEKANPTSKIADAYDDMLQECVKDFFLGASVGLVTGLILFRGKKISAASAGLGGGFGLGYGYRFESVKYDAAKAQLGGTPDSEKRVVANASLKIAEHYDEMIQECAMKLGYGLVAGTAVGILLCKKPWTRGVMIASGGGMGIGYAYAQESVRFQATKAQLAAFAPGN